MALGLHLLEDVLDSPVRANHEGSPHYPHHFLPIHVLLLDNTVLIADLPVGVTQQGKGQVELLFELFLGRGRVGRDAEHDRPSFLGLSVRITELAGFDGASRSVGARIEIQHHPLPAKILQRNRISVLVRQSEIRGFIIDIHDCVSWPS